MVPAVTIPYTLPTDYLVSVNIEAIGFLNSDITRW